MKPSNTSSASAGIGMPVWRPLITSIGRPMRGCPRSRIPTRSGPGVDGADRAEHRRLADADHHRAMLAALPVFAADDVAMLAVLDEDDERVLVVHLHPVGAEIDPVAVGIAGDDQAFGADVAAAVVLVPLRRREGVDVDGAAFEHVLQHRAFGDDDRAGSDRPSCGGACDRSARARARPRRCRTPSRRARSPRPGSRADSP